MAKDTNEQIEATAEEILHLPLNLIEPDETQPRKTFDEADLKELAASIKQHGVLSPILVRPAASGNGGWTIIFGERRYRACLALGMADIPCRVFEASTRATLEIQIVENMQRKGVHIVEEAHAVRRLQKDFDLTIEEISKKLGKARSWIHSLLRISAVCEEAQKAALDGELTGSVLLKIAVLPEPEQQRLATATLRRQRGKLLTADFAQKWLQKTFGALKPKPPKKTAAGYAFVETDTQSNWKKYFLRFNAAQFERWQAIVNGNPDTEVWAKAVGKVMENKKGDDEQP